MQAIKKDIVFSLGFIGIGIFITSRAFSYSYDSSAFLRSMAIILTVMAIAYLFISLFAYTKKQVKSKTSSPSTESFPKALLVFLLVGGYIFIIPLIGFLASTIIFAYASMVCFSKKHRNVYLVYGVLLSLSVYLLFFKILGVALPESFISISQYLNIT